MCSEARALLIVVAIIACVLLAMAWSGTFEPTRFERDAARVALIERCRAMGGAPVLLYDRREQVFNLERCALPAQEAH